VPGTRVVRLLLLLVLALAWPLAHAQAVIEAVQFPAWLERAGARSPLLPGTVLHARDGIFTGAEGRARLRLAEGSRVRLGENARVELRRDELHVAEGAFRFTTGNARAAQDVALRVGQMEVLSRGADLWGQAGPPGILVLVSGSATVSTAGGAPAALERPLDRYELPQGGAPAFSRLRGEALAEITRGVELAPEGATAEAAGRWRVFVGKFESGVHARALQARVREAGYPAEVAGGTARSPYVVMVPRLAGEAAARAAMARLRAVEGAGILTVSESSAP
jgi:hypothetical protein